ncbi:MAG: hypothetical protein QG656_116, partial [Candidatus Hydrogenedentes bacterium]|nr:hypothetical protein [Candidatus Hydrogenedentota bacterium]
VVFLFPDQWRAQATGYAGDPNAKTPNLDRLAGESVHFVNAISGCPVCSPYRASLLTGQYPLTHGVFLNDVHLRDEAVSLAEAFKAAGYDTAYIGKWHVDGHGRSNYIPRERRQGFDFWKVLECTHDYNNSPYYADEDVKLKWEGYDAIAQTREAERYIRDHPKDKPFVLILSWGSPHDPYQTAPEAYRAMFSPEQIQLRPNVPDEAVERARKDLAGYYAHIAALDACVGDVCKTLAECGIANDTLLVFTSDHGDMLGSQGHWMKQRPYDESIRVPFLVRYPAKLGAAGRTADALINAPDIMPTLLGLSGVAIPESVEGLDYTGYLLGGPNPGDDAALLTCPAPFGQFPRAKGGKEYRGVRTKRYTYCRDLDGPWLLFDNEQDPYQRTNLCNAPECAGIQAELEAVLAQMLRETHDEFLPAQHYIDQWGYTTDATGTVPYTH